MNPANNIAVLTGNGTSIDFSRDLALDKLTTAITERLGEGATQGLTDASYPFGIPDVRDFESLLGPLDTWEESLAVLARMGNLVPLIPRQRSFNEATERVREGLALVRRFGVGHALEVIDERSYAAWASREHLVRFMQELKAAAWPGLVRMGNLNYDCLNLAAMGAAFGNEMCDMARGGRPALVKVVPGEEAVGAWPIRTEADLLPLRHQLVHLHGSTGWLRDPKGTVWKVRIEDVRRVGFWDAYRTGKTDWSPVVVLTNQRLKSSVVQTAPFQLAYQVFGTALRTSTRWLVVGYSFRDEAVNDLLAREYEAHAVAPSLLVVTMGTELTEDAVRVALRLPREQSVTILRDGMRAAPASPEWSAWAAQLPALHRVA